MAQLVNPLSCSDSSAAASESIVGSGTAGVGHWLMLEYSSRWEPKAWEGASIPAQVRAHVDAALAATPGSRIQLIRRFDSCDGGAIRVFVADTRPGVETIHRLRIENYDALLDIDLTAAMAGQLPPNAEQVGALFLVCTHGKRDQCCALHGMPVYRALSAIAPLDTWQASHLGGHRFAPTAVVFPTGLHLGRLTPEAMPTLVAAHKSGCIADLDTVRGRTAYPAAAQAAEILVRQRDGLLGYSDVLVEGFQRTDVTAWRADLVVRGERESVGISAARQSIPIHKSCAKPDATYALDYSLTVD